jgi:hypothetical protein
MMVSAVGTGSGAWAEHKPAQELNRKTAAKAVRRPIILRMLLVGRGPGKMLNIVNANKDTNDCAKLLDIAEKSRMLPPS